VSEKSPEDGMSPCEKRPKSGTDPVGGLRGNGSQMISVIICTYNRSNSLRNTLKSLQEMSVPTNLRWELIVVDNNSKDDTREVVKDCAVTSGLNIKYVFEGKQGLSHARNRSIAEAKGDILAFTDDDCIVSGSWVQSIFKEFKADPEISVIGGRVELYNPNDRPVTTRTCKERVRFSVPGQFVNLMAGCNMAVGRQIFAEVGMFDPDFGAGAMFLSSEDSDFLYRAYKNNLKIVYSPDVLVYHNHGRRTEAQVESLKQGYVVGRGAFYCKHILRGDRDVLKLAFREVCSLIISLLVTLVVLKPIKGQKRLLGGLAMGAVLKLRSSRQQRGYTGVS